MVYPVAACRGRTNVGGSASPLLTDLFAYYTLDEASGTAVDALATRNLTAFNSPVSTTGKIGNARAFVRASSQYLKSSATDFNTTNSFSIAFWLNTSDISVQPPIMGVGDDYNTLMIDHTVGGRVRMFRGGLSNACTSTATVSATTTAHAVFTVNGSTGATKCYINGSAGGTATNTTTPSNGAINIGTSSFAWYGGWVDECGFWTRELSADDVALLYNSGSGRTYPFA